MPFALSAGSLVVAATDFSDDAANAVRRAGLLASLHETRLEVLHVLSRSSLDAVREWFPAGTAERVVADARVLLDAVAAESNAHATTRLIVGDALVDIMENCTSAALLAIGARGVNPLRDAILGTTAERLVGRYGAPVLVVKTPASTQYANVLVALDLLPGSQSLLEAAMGFAAGAAFAAAHAYDVPFDGALQRAGVAVDVIERYREEALFRARAAIRALADTAGGIAVPVQPLTDRTHPARLIVDGARARRADLIVIGKRKRSAVESLVLGSITRHVLADAECDVLVVPMAP